ncbi:MAG: hypothetical protein U9N59_12895 [Campylobacterota bacterium]|nr:hypothetical protein [Campylobacterota bacterium]
MKYNNLDYSGYLVKKQKLLKLLFDNDFDQFLKKYHLVELNTIKRYKILDKLKACGSYNFGNFWTHQDSTFIKKSNQQKNRDKNFSDMSEVIAYNEYIRPILNYEINLHKDKDK